MATVTITPANGVTNTVPKFSGAASIVKSTIVEVAGKVGIGVPAPASNLDVNGTIRLGGTVPVPGVVVNAACNVGIGIDPTRNPQEKLTLAPDSNLATEMLTPTGVAAAPSPTSGGLPVDDYYFRVTASDGTGWTKASAQLRFDLLDPDHGIRISWNPVLGATKYRVYRALTAPGAYKYIDVTTTYYDYVSDATFIVTAAPPEETTAYMNKLSAAGSSWLLGCNVGIGSTSPLANVGNGSLKNSLETRGWIVAKGNGANTWGDGATRIGVYAPGGSDNDGAWWFSANPDHSFAIHQGGYGDRFNITTGGNVGIGTIGV
ncbi:MAG: hypothetical protein ACKVRP_12715, partial [Bacteroidota bacterium]